MKKQFLLSSLMVLLVVFLAACSSSESSETEAEAEASTGSGNESETTDNSESKAKQVVTFWHSMGGAGQEALNAIVESYNSSQDEIQVNAEYQGTYDESLTKFNAVAGSDSAPTMIQTFEIGTKAMINSGQIAPIQEFIDADGYDMSGLEENITNYYSLDGTFYSMPFNSSTPVMYYNKDAFEAAGLDPEAAPETFEEIIEANKAIAKANPKMKGFALQAYGWLWEQLLANQGALLLNNDNGRSETPTEIGWSEEEGKSIFNWVKQMVDDETFANYGTNGDNMVAGFLAGDVAMFLQSSASSRDVIDNAPFEVGIAYLPHPEEKERQGVVIGGASLWMIDSKPEEEKKAAWEFMKFLQTPEVQAQWHVGTGYFAINPSAYGEQVVVDAYAEKPQLQVTVDQLQDTKSSFATQGALMDMLPEGRKIMETALETVYNGGDVDEAYNTAVEQFNAAIQKANAARGE
ncbi:ABC transporter substrate-binding protein [Ureibacillus chungkukjangi]|uniref:Carbohydrate ABC transporter substrate-binding protein (CUT1 family) n=1 Tax=Ureibacillus chungkukjangi TaxID=1202712 RepID=A0A318TW11_9BACL|nr:ABC transporter substrate-binding protein [Ureibacillus chungkukjangi]MCM3387743.1 ABC transporter substrate-binding protein [Ureibacillus chungkukjangi]PYF08060.1 carbohydrate ABC transporter substrate-binding protein (CUT1 family) [Ureibacillus chungkukjangi]